MIYSLYNHLKVKTHLESMLDGKDGLEHFELYAEGKGVTDLDQKKSLLLHSAEMDVQDVFFTLPNGEGDNAYAKAKDVLTKYFSPLLNVPFDRHKFRTTVHGQDESVAQYIVRLRQKADTCEFRNNNAVEIQIRDQEIEKCKSHKLRRKLLERGRDLSLRQLRDISRAFEDSEQQATMIEGAAQEVNKLSFLLPLIQEGQFGRLVVLGLTSL